MQEQHREDGARLRAGQRDRLPSVNDLERTEDPELLDSLQPIFRPPSDLHTMIAALNPERQASGR
jgi:hypothetical protein